VIGGGRSRLARAHRRAWPASLLQLHAQREVNDGDVQQLVRRIADRVLRALRKAGKWVDPEAAAVEGGGRSANALVSAMVGSAAMVAGSRW